MSKSGNVEDMVYVDGGYPTVDGTSYPNGSFGFELASGPRKSCVLNGISLPNSFDVTAFDGWRYGWIQRDGTPDGGLLTFSVDSISNNLKSGDKARKLVETLEGTGGRDVLMGGNIQGQADTLVGYGGDDLYIAAGKRLIIVEAVDGGVDTVRAAVNVNLSQPSNFELNRIRGLDNIENVELTGKAALKLIGSDVDNTLKGNAGNNRISGAAGDDILYGGIGNDQLSGGEGVDTFVFDTEPRQCGDLNFLFKTGRCRYDVDTITDFDGDIIQLSSTVFSGLDPDQDDVINFVSAPGLKAAADDTSSWMVYDEAAGKLYYDAAGANAVLVAKVGLFGKLNAHGMPVRGSDFHAATLSADHFKLM